MRRASGMKRALFALAVAVLAAGAPRARVAADGPVIETMDTVCFQPPREKGRVSVVPGKVGNALRFAFDTDCRSTFFTSDGRTIGRFLMANDVDLSFARVAYTNSGSEEVKAFARRMLTDHTQIIATMRALSADEDIAPSDDDAGRDLRDLSTLQRDTLRALTGRAFDETYVAMELERHRAILSMIDDVLLPRARSSELRELLASTRPIIAAHIAHAEQLEATLSKR